MNISEMTIPQLKAELTNLGVSFKAKDKKADLQVALENALIDQAKSGSLEVGPTEPKPLPMTPAREAKKAKHIAAYSGIEATETAKRKASIMGLHYRGRAVGLKLYQLMGLAIGRTTPPVHKPASHMPNSERVQKYARQLTPDAPYINVFPKLTHRQMRRVMKAADKHGEGFVYSSIKAQESNPLGMGPYSLLARTPNGLGIFHQFSN